MKNQTLSIEQMKHLKTLGVDVGKAGVVLLFSDEYGECVRWEVENHGKEQPLYEFYDEEVEHWISTTAEYFDSDTGNYDHSYRESCGVFTLQDMLEMMPTSICDNSYFLIAAFDELVDTDTRVYTIRYASVSHKDFCYFEGISLINATYQMLCWLAQNGHLKGGKP